MRNLALLFVIVPLIAACSSGGPDTGTVWIRNESASPVNVEVVTSFGGWLPSTEDATIVVDGAGGAGGDQTAAYIGAGPVTIRVSGAAVAGVQTVTFAQPEAAATTPSTALDHTLDIDAAGHVVLAPGDPPPGWRCPPGSPGLPPCGTD